MWILTSGGDPRCRIFLNSQAMTAIGHMSGQSFNEAIAPDLIKGIAPEATVLFGQEAGCGRLRFLLAFQDDEKHQQLACVQAAVRDALSGHAGLLDMEALARILLPK